MEQAEADTRGETLHDDDDDDMDGSDFPKPSNTTPVPAPPSFSSRNEALALIHTLRGYVSQLHDPRDAAALSLLHNLSTEFCHSSPSCIYP